MTPGLQEYQALSSKMLKQVIIRPLAELLSLEEAIILQQIHYWVEKCGKLLDKQLWVYNTLEQWGEQFPYWSNSKIFRIVQNLVKKELVFIDKKNSFKGNQTNWYAINYPLLCKKLKEQLSENQEFDHLDEEEWSFLDQCFELESSLVEKNFTSFQNEKPFCQSDKIIISNTKNNLHKNNYLSKEDDGEKGKITYRNLKPDRQQINFSQEEMEICTQMVDTWNKVFIRTKDKISFSERRGHKILSLWHNVMEQNLENWEDFCLKVNTSKFLMGEKENSKFKAYSDWLLKEDIAKRIITGEYGVGDRLPDNQELYASRKKLPITPQGLAEAKKAKIYKLFDQLTEQELARINQELCATNEEREKIVDEFYAYMANLYDNRIENLKYWKTYGYWRSDEKRFKQLLGWYKIYRYTNKQYNDYLNLAKKLVNEEFNESSCTFN